MYRLCFDYGHGGRDPGAVYKGRKESDDNLSIGLEVAKALRQYGIEIDETRTSDVTMNLNQRSAFANIKDYDYFISFHRNAFVPEIANGAETYIYTNTTTNSRSLGEKIQMALVKVGFRDRGVKTATFHVLKETKAPAVLIEIGFIDSTKDNKLFDSKRNEIIKGITKAILEQLGIDEVPSNIEESPSTVEGKQTFYRVMAGSFLVKENANKQVENLRKAGFDATILEFHK